MCTIIADASGEPGLSFTVPQVVEGLVYSKERREAIILLDFMVRNTRDDSSSLLLIHPGAVSRMDAGASLVLAAVPAGVEPRDTPEDVLRRVYSHRLRRDAHDPIQFRERDGAYLLKQGQATTIDWCGPHLISPVSISEERYPLSSGRVRPFTCFKIAGLRAGVSWFHLQLKLEGASYDHFIGDHSRFWVDGPVHVRELIESDLDVRRNQDTSPYSTFFRSAFAPERVIHPRAYDIAVFRRGTEGVDTEVLCTPASAAVYEVKAHAASDLAHLFVTSSCDFWIDLEFAESAAMTKQRISAALPASAG